MRKINIEKEILEKLYIHEKKSMKEIHEELGIGYNTVKRLFNEYNIPKRDRVDSSNIVIKKKYDKIGRKTTLLNCPVCNKEFHIKNSLLDKSDTHCCSISCASKFSAKRKNIVTVEKTGDIVKCFVCEKDIYRNKARLNSNKRGIHFCGNDCLKIYLKSEYNLGANHPNYNRKKVRCSKCNKEIERNAYAIDRNKQYHFCSRECMSIFYIGLVYGENHPSWKGGGNLYYGPDWDRISWNIRSKYNFTCQRCGLTLEDVNGDTSKIIVHHINKRRNFKCYKEANKEENLVPLCIWCHGIVEYHGMDFEFKRI